jgi:hypothetical protein
LKPAQLGEDRPLDRQVLDRRLDDQLALGKVGEVRDDVDPVGDGTRSLSGHPTLGREVGQALRHTVGGRGCTVWARVVEVDVVSGDGRDLRDPGAHGPGSDDRDVAPRTVGRHDAILP